MGPPSSFGFPCSGKFQEWGFILQVKEVWVGLYTGPPSSAKNDKIDLESPHFQFSALVAYSNRAYSMRIWPSGVPFYVAKEDVWGRVMSPFQITKGTTEGHWSKSCIGVHTPFLYRCRSLPFLFLDEFFCLKTWEDSFILLEADSDEQLASIVIKRGGGIFSSLLQRRAIGECIHHFFLSSGRGISPLP